MLLANKKQERKGKEGRKERKEAGGIGLRASNSSSKFNYFLEFSATSFVVQG
jgi:hypothetical protein